MATVVTLHLAEARVTVRGPEAAGTGAAISTGMNAGGGPEAAGMGTAITTGTSVGGVVAFFLAFVLTGPNPAECEG